MTELIAPAGVAAAEIPPTRDAGDGGREARDRGVRDDRDLRDPDTRGSDTRVTDTRHRLERRFGDPEDPDNPVGYEAFLRADERGDLLPAGRTVLDDDGFTAEFVPAELGGRLRQADELVRTLRPVFRRDAAMGLGHGAINLIAAAPVWLAGSAEQRRWLADVLLAGGQASGAYTELQSGHDLTRSQVRADRHGEDYLLGGRKEVINNVHRADSVTLLARTGTGSGGRDHSLFLVDMREVERDRLRFLPRFGTSGLRAVHLAGVEFQDTPIPSSAVLGEVGGALETVLRAFQVTKATLTGAVVGCFDTQLRTVTRFALSRRLYQRTVAELPHARAVLTDAFADVLVCDSLSTVVCRALHVLPKQTAVLAPAAKFLVPTVIQESVDNLAIVLGARSFLREGPHGVFQKHLRDLPVASLAHSGTTVSQGTVIPQLTRLARRAWLVGEPAPAELFRFEDRLPALDFQQFEISAGARDDVLAVLPSAYETLRDDPDLGPLCGQLLEELRGMKAACLELGARDRTPFAQAAGFDLAERYAILLACAACLGVWLHNQDSPDPFLRDPAWITLALRRMLRRLGCPVPSDGGHAGAAVFAELVERERENRAFDLGGRQLG